MEESETTTTEPLPLQVGDTKPDLKVPAELLKQEETPVEAKTAQPVASPETKAPGNATLVQAHKTTPVDPPTPKPEPKAEVPANDEIELRRLRAVEALEKEARDNKNERRLKYLNDIGKKDGFKDVHLLALAPDVDPRTPEGRAAFDEFRQKNPEFFNNRETASFDAAAMASKIPESRHGTFGAKFFEQTLRAVMGKK